VERHDDAIAMQESRVARSVQALGEEDLETLNLRANLASSYRQAGRTQHATELQRLLVADLERILGADHPATKGAKRMLELG